MSPRKYTINFLLNLKCKNCQDTTFCKLQDFYKIIENPTQKDIKNLTDCIFYNKKTLLFDKQNLYN